MLHRKLILIVLLLTGGPLLAAEMNREFSSAAGPFVAERVMQGLSVPMSTECPKC